VLQVQVLTQPEVQEQELPVESVEQPGAVLVQPAVQLVPVVPLLLLYLNWAEQMTAVAH
jgi:hypothetical protein